MEGNTPATQLFLFGSIFSYISQDAQSLCVQGLVLSFCFCICGYSDNSCTFGSMSCFKLFYLLEHYGMYHIFKQCSCNTINHASFTLLGCFSYTTFATQMQRKRLRCKENQRNRISESIRRRCFQHCRLTSALNQEILIILSKFTQYNERNYSVLQEVGEFDVRAKLCRYNR